MKYLAIILSISILLQSFSFKRDCGGVCCHSQKNEFFVNAKESFHFKIDNVRFKKLTKENHSAKKCCQSQNHDDKNDKDSDMDKSCCGDSCMCCGKLAKTLILHFSVHNFPIYSVIYSANCFHYQISLDNLDTKGIFHPPIFA